MKNLSLRRRLLLMLLTTTAVVWLFTAITSYRDTRHEVGELFDAQLAQSAHTLLAISHHELEELQDAGRGISAIHIHSIPDTFEREHGHKYEHKLAFQVWTGDHQLMLRSESAPATPLAPPTPGFSDQMIKGHRWRVFAFADPDSDFRIQVGENYGIREELINHIALRIAAPMIFGLPVLAVLIWLLVGRALSPLVRFAREVSERAPTRLDPLETDEAPEETRPLLQALNHLFERLRHAFDNERRFTADASHELRTPLAALKAQAQVALRSGDPAVRERALNQVLLGVDRATHLVEQLLTLARLDPESATLENETVDLCRLAAETMAELTPAADLKGIELTLSDPCTGRVNGHSGSLAILLRNLVDNAIRYTPQEGRVAVEVLSTKGHLALIVEDSGPGIPESQRERIFERFYRNGESGESGCGLGLSIVRRIAELYRADIRLGQSRLGGLRVELTFPADARYQ